MTYGIFDAPENIRRTRNSKHQMENDCWMIIQYAKQFMEAARRCPEIDDEHHSEVVERMAEEIHSARQRLKTAMEIKFGRDI